MRNPRRSKRGKWKKDNWKSRRWERDYRRQYDGKTDGNAKKGSKYGKVFETIALIFALVCIIGFLGVFSVYDLLNTKAMVEINANRISYLGEHQHKHRSLPVFKTYYYLVENTDTHMACVVASGSEDWRERHFDGRGYASAEDGVTCSGIIRGLAPHEIEDVMAGRIRSDTRTKYITDAGEALVLGGKRKAVIRLVLLLFFFLYLAGIEIVERFHIKLGYAADCILGSLILVWALAFALMIRSSVFG
ncbi:MAG: hypothetical protein IKO10_18850 [Lachnospiraceae bacterium]|nr:hypothetical protein [Lachnospiraceae bacterium]